MSDVSPFDLVIDGESLAFGWEAASFAAAQERGLPVGRLLLRHGRLYC